MHLYPTQLAGFHWHIYCWQKWIH